MDAELDFKRVDELAEQGYIARQKHPTLPLYIYNYTHKAQFDGMWTPETMACRGLITDLDLNIVARPFPKFFNYEQHQGPLPDGKFEVYEKMDGSLIIATLYEGKLVVATRGSFTSDQALHAAKLLNEDYVGAEFLPNKTYLFEVIYPENRIVVDYKGRDELVLLAIIHTPSGQEFPLPTKNWGSIPVVNRYQELEDERKISGLTAETGRENFEGYVVRWENGFRLKMKFEEYKRLHRLVTGVNAKTIWELLKAGKGIEELLTHVPDEFYSWVKDTTDNLELNYEAVEVVTKCQFEEIAQDLIECYGRFEDAPRKDFAKRAMKSTYSDILFQMLDGKDYSQAIWKRIRPVAERPYKTVSEDAS